MKRFFWLLAAALLAACAPLAAPALPSGPTLDATSYPTMQAAEPASTQSIGGFNLTFQRAWRDGKTVNADICFTLPDASDWTIWNAHFDYSAQSVTNFSTTLLSTQPGSGGLPGQRCDQISFYVPPDADLSSASITIESIGAYPSRDEYCSLYMPKIQQSLDARGIAITLTCTPDASGAQTMQIASKPASMSEADAEKIVYSDEFFTVKGPWRFPVGLGQ